MAITFKKSIGSPVAVDIGNQTTQGRIVSKTMQFGLFTTNENAVWGSQQQLQKESYPFAYISVVVNRNMFRLQVGDVFKFSYSRYGVTDMICRVLQIEEESLKSEKITIHAMEDIFSIANAITSYTDPTNNTQEAPDYAITAFATGEQAALIAPYVASPTAVGILPLANQDDPLLLGYDVYMSLDGGSSYQFLQRSSSLQPLGTLNADYPITYDLDDYTDGIVVDFVAGQSAVETITWSEVFSGSENIALIGDELISFQSVTPITADQYRLEGIVRGRYGTVKAAHSALDNFWVIDSATLLTSPEIVAGAERMFKYVPFNSRFTGDIADAIAITVDLSVPGVGAPYIPGDFIANGSRMESLYKSGDDITLDWCARKRGVGAGIGIPGIVLAEDSREGLFTVEVWVSAVLVRTTTAIDAITWDYTNAMNVADNTTPASEITFKLSNYVVDSGITYESEQTEVTCIQN